MAKFKIVKTASGLNTLYKKEYWSWPFYTWKFQAASSHIDSLEKLIKDLIDSNTITETIEYDYKGDKIYYGW